MAKVEMIKRLFKGDEPIVCKECGKDAKEETEDIMLFMPYCGNCRMRIEDANHNYCGNCGDVLLWDKSEGGE